MTGPEKSSPELIVFGMEIRHSCLEDAGLQKALYQKDKLQSKLWCGA